VAAGAEVAAGAVVGAGAEVAAGAAVGRGVAVAAEPQAAMMNKSRTVEVSTSDLENLGQRCRIV
jgi:carbonic anhydrase/acetyltransferase-like protein (isoleucine patch superfamily)